MIFMGDSGLRRCQKNEKAPERTRCGAAEAPKLPDGRSDFKRRQDGKVTLIRRFTRFPKRRIAARYASATLWIQASR
jgi:hypothetical protein